MVVLKQDEKKAVKLAMSIVIGLLGLITVLEAMTSAWAWLVGVGAILVAVRLIGRG